MRKYTIILDPDTEESLLKDGQLIPEEIERPQMITIDVAA